ncbi:hypothetical protein [Leptospira licerasiae]|uniref:hypothetical protein n=1 Tax=Leptospira licerasiae TaxID=447106 RepID=UPI000248B6F0|nr:hypothetical protein [Leptospira licerasiae]EIE01217.1 hypothetical protein LEP1GSC185_3877 [Leptospira licerasiae serovar Varillal str. VAR 010]
MAKPTDKERFFANLPIDGKPISNKALKAVLEYDDDKYLRIRKELLDEGRVSIGRGYGGSVYRIADIDISNFKEIKSKKEDKYKSELTLYDSFLKTIKEKHTAYFEYDKYIIQKTAHSGSRNTGGVWTRPDITLITVQTFPYIPNKILDIITFELKHYKDFSIVGVFECAAHTRFSNKSYLSIYFPEDEFQNLSDDDFERIKGECERFKIGLVIFSDPENYDTFHFHVDPERNSPDPSEQNEFLSQQIKEDNRKILLTYLR